MQASRPQQEQPHTDRAEKFGALAVGALVLAALYLLTQALPHYLAAIHAAA